MVGRFPGSEYLNESFLTMIYARLSHQSSNGIEKVLLTELAFLSQSKIINLPVIFPVKSYILGIRQILNEKLSLVVWFFENHLSSILFQ